MERLTTEAIVLKTVACGEADRMVALFTRDLGRVSAFAAHARKSRRRFAGALDPFTVIRAALVERRGETWRLDSAEVVDGMFEIRRDLSLIARAGYAVELVHELCRDREPHLNLYSSIHTFLAHLARSSSLPTDLLRFELEALAAVGLSPQLSVCSICGLPRAAGDGFDPARGGIVCSRCAERAARPYPEGAQLLAALQAGESAATGRALKEAKKALEEFLEYHLGVRLRSPQFMADIGVE